MGGDKSIQMQRPERAIAQRNGAIGQVVTNVTGRSKFLSRGGHRVVSLTVLQQLQIILL